MLQKITWVIFLADRTPLFSILFTFLGVFSASPTFGNLVQISYLIETTCAEAAPPVWNLQSLCGSPTPAFTQRNNAAPWTIRTLSKNIRNIALWVYTFRMLGLHQIRTILVICCTSSSPIGSILAHHNVPRTQIPLAKSIPCYCSTAWWCLMHFY